MSKYSEIKRVIEEAAECVKRDEDNAAQTKLEYVFSVLRDYSGDEKTDLYNQAGRVLMDLRQTDNEYVWESTAYLFDEYMEWLDCKNN